MARSEPLTYGCLVCDFGTDEWVELEEHHWTHSREEWEGPDQ